jgi:hypothetical protein
MKALIASLLLLSSTALADVTTSFTLGGQLGNYAVASTQDGQPTSGIWSVDYIFDCGLTHTCGTYGQQPLQNIYITLPNDPINPGNRLNINCTGVIDIDTRPTVGSKVQQPPGVLEATETCQFKESWYSGTWTGTITYNYKSVLQRHCSSGHPVCVTRYYPVLVNGTGALTTPDPPPMPPPPPPPVVSVIGSGAIDLNTEIVFILATPNQVLAQAQFDLVDYLAILVNTDGTTPLASLDYWTVYPVGDDGETFTYSVYGTIFNADGTSWGIYDCELTADVNGVVSGGTLTEFPF